MAGGYCHTGEAESENEQPFDRLREKRWDGPPPT